MNKYKIGLDLGGTKLLGIIVDSGNNILKTKKIKVQKNITIDELLDEIVNIYNSLSDGLNINRLGLAVPSSVQFETGIATFLPAYGWRDIQFKKILEDKLGIKVKVDNDVNMATLAEYKLGAGIGVKSLYTFYPGTGIGGGYISNGQLVRGNNGTAGEIGHMIVDINGTRCNCGQYGCLETIVSNTAFKRILRESITNKIYHGNIDPDIAGSSDILEAWNSGDNVLQDLLKYQAKVLGIAIANIVNITGVERIIVGGHFYHVLEDKLLHIVEDSAIKYAIGDGMKGVDVLLNKLGPEAPALGVTLL
jgi:predicted NBD/HSP70 family sugar kinase